MIIIIIIIIIIVIKWLNVITQDNTGQRSPLLIVCGAGLGLFQGRGIFTAALLWRSSHFACMAFACACVKGFLLPALPSLWVGLGKYLKTFH